MKKFHNIIFIVLTLLLIAPSILHAQETASTQESTSQETVVDENTTKVTNKYFDLTLTQGLQSPLDKSIIYKLTIVPHISSSKTQILWNGPSSMSIRPWHSEFVNLNQGEEYVYRAVIKPTQGGTYRINVSVIAWQYDTNYTNNVSDDIVLSNSLVSYPITPEYTISVVIEILFIIAIFAGIIWGGMKISKKFMKKTKKWLTPPV